MPAKKAKLSFKGEKCVITLSKQDIIRFLGTVEGKTLFIGGGNGQLTLTREAALPLPYFLASAFQEL